jgi:deoxyuridine 5''-triphosphate nucleotidohydrolase (dut)
MGAFDPKIKEEIAKQFEKIQSELGIEPDEEYQKELEEMLGLSIEDMEDEINLMSKTRIIKVELTNEDSVFPKYAYPSDSGFDLHAAEEVIIGPFGRALVPTGLKVSFEEGYEIQVRPKSGLAIKQGLTVLNTPGTVDQGYTGEIQVIVFNTNNTTVTIPKGMKVGQGVLCPVVQGKYVVFEQVNKVEDKDRGNNGFGSTGII